MRIDWTTRRNIVLWQFLFIILSTTWLWAPHLNHVLSYRTSLISQYEAPGQPFAWVFRLGDMLSAALLIWVAQTVIAHQNKRKIAGYLLLIIGLGLLIDSLLPTSCRLEAGVCREYFSFSFLVHAIETVITASALFVIGVYDSWLRKRLVSIAFVAFQIVYGGLFLSQLANQDHFNTFSQYLYQLMVVVWLAWFVRDFFISSEAPVRARAQVVKLAVAGWAFLNGLLAIIVSLGHLNLFGRLHRGEGLYFAGNNAWLAQHGAIIGVIMLYLSRHLLRGERRARQIFLAIVGLETLKYSVLTPNFPLMLIYLLTFCALFVMADEFDRGSVAVTVEVRLKDALFMLGSLLLYSLIGLIILSRTQRLSRITAQSIDHFFDYTVRSQILPRTQVKSALLAHTISAFLLAGIAAILWSLFRPYKAPRDSQRDYRGAEELLGQFSESTEDYFKIWPPDKDYFWSADGGGFIAYKVEGPIAFALADPICAPNSRAKLLEEFITWARSRRLRACFLPVYEKRLALYEAADLNSLQIGASALVKIDTFINDTTTNKWWRWQKNRATKNGYQYGVSRPPHARGFIGELKIVSDAWLSKEGHEERGFALGYFDSAYLNRCTVSYLRNANGDLVAFTNHLPTFKPLPVASIDLLRYLPDVNNAMPYLLLKTIESLREAGSYKYFDLGFVPFAAAKNPVIAIARTLSAGRFSARGLEQFKNKFNPEWQPNYLAYEGDLADLALIVTNIDAAMRPKT